MKFFRSYKMLTAATVFVSSLAGVFALILIDDVNGLRSPLLNNNFLSSLLSKMGMERIDFSMKGLTCFCATYIDIVAFFFAMLYSGTLGLYFRIRNRKFNAGLFYITVSLLFVIIFAGILFVLDMKPYDFMEIAIIYGYFFVFFFITAALFFVLCIALSFLYAHIKKEKFEFPTADPIRDLEKDEEVQALAKQAATRSLFPDLIRIDERYKDFTPDRSLRCNILSLKDLADGFREYAYLKHGVNYNITSVRSFISGLAMARLVFVRGAGEEAIRFISIFAEYAGGNFSSLPVQKDWDGDADLLGYYSEREGVFICSTFVEKLYESTYDNGKLDMIAFTQMGTADVYEYFGSVFDAVYRNAFKPQLNLMHVKKGAYDGKTPQKLSNGSVVMGNNVWILGALDENDQKLAEDLSEDFVVVSVVKTRAKFAVNKKCKPLQLQSEELNELFEQAQNTEKFKLTVPEVETFLSVADTVYDSFNIRIDGATLDYIQIFVSCYVFCGGTKEEALDIIFLKKIFSKVKGMRGAHILNGLTKLEDKIIEKYGKSEFKGTRAEIKKEIARAGKPTKASK